MDDGRWTMDDGRWTMDDGRNLVVFARLLQEITDISRPFLPVMPTAWYLLAQYVVPFGNGMPGGEKRKGATSKEIAPFSLN